MTSQHLSDIDGYAAMRTAELQQAAAARKLSHDALESEAPRSPWYARFRFTRGRRFARKPATVSTLPAKSDKGGMRPAA